MQAAWRGYVVRRNLSQLAAKAIVVQRHFRGHMGRKRFQAAWASRAASRRRYVFDAAATSIQSAWRGYVSRATVHSFFAQKAYIAAVLERNEALHGEAIAAYEAQREATEVGAAEAAHSRFLRAVTNMHHMLSTQSRPGIYNSPFAVVSGGRPNVGGKAVEDCIRDTTLLLDMAPRSMRASAAAEQALAAADGEAAVARSEGQGAMRGDGAVEREVNVTHASPMGLQAPIEPFDSLLASMSFMDTQASQRRKKKEPAKKPIFHTSVHAPPLFN